MTIDNTEAYAGFGGRVGRTFAGSESWWPEKAIAPEGASNIVVIMCDDLGFSDLGCYGSEIDTLNLDRLAAEGLRYTDFNVTPMCSPTRASLLTGLNSHAAGVGHVAHSDPGFPGYEMELVSNAATLGEVLMGHGYASYMVGKWHLAKDSNCSEAGPRHSWPCQKGFERFYGILDGFTNLHHPHRLVEDNHHVEVDQYPDDYFFTDDITERALSMIRGLKASDPTKPFFLYFAHGAVHAPLHARAETIAKYADRYHGGWDQLRIERLGRMVDLGIMPKGTSLPTRNAEDGSDVLDWNELDPRQQELFARYMAVYAAMVEEIDASFGQFRSGLEALGIWDDTMVLFTSDNGASREGEVNGTSAYYTHLLGHDDWEADYERLDLIGGPQTTPHYPRGWAMASNTPFRLYKINTHAGGRRVPLIVSWPSRLADAAGEFRSQFTHVTDVMPTILELVGAAIPTERGGEKLKELVGESFVATLTDPDVAHPHTEQYYEMWGHRGFQRGEWEAVTLHQPMTEFGDHEWELYRRDLDPTEVHDLSAEEPAKLAELAAAWEEAAWANQVYPLEEGTFLKHILRPPWDEVWSRPVTLTPQTPTLERWRSLQLIWFRSFVISSQITQGAGDEGVLVAHGDQGGGYVLWIEDGQLQLAHNDGRQLRSVACGPVSPGDHEIVVSFHAPGSNIWNVTVSIDHSDVASAEGWPLFVSMAPFEGIDIGLDRRSPVSWDLFERHGAYRYTGTIHTVDYDPGERSPDAPFNLVDLLREMGQKFE